MIDNPRTWMTTSCKGEDEFSCEIKLDVVAVPAPNPGHCDGCVFLRDVAVAGLCELAPPCSAAERADGWPIIWVHRAAPEPEEEAR